MYRDINVLKLLPDRPGRGGTKFGYHAFQQEPINDTRETLNVHVWQDSWRTDVASTSVVQGNNFDDETFVDPGEKSSLALHGYSKFSLTRPSAGPTTLILGHNIASIGGVEFGYVWNYTDWMNGTYYGLTPGGPFWTGTTHVVCNASATHPAVFVNVRNRCFIATGEDEAKIYDATRVTDFETDGPPKVYTVGVGAPALAPTILPANVKEFAEAYLHVGSTFISSPDVNGALSNAVSPGTDTLIVEADGVTWDAAGTKVDIVDPTSTFSTTGLAISIDNGSRIATIDPALSIPPDNEWVGLTLSVAGFEFVMMEFGNAVGHDPALTSGEVKLDHILQNGRQPLDPDGNGDPWNPAGDIVSAPFSVTGYRWKMQHGAADVVWPAGTSGDFTVMGNLINTGGLLAWDTAPPSYAYAWYDPITGHVSNISPIFGPTETSKTNVGVQVPIDVGQISYPPSTSSIGTTRWTHILFFRTLMAGGSTLYPIGSLDPDSSGWRGLPNTDYPTIPPTGTGNAWYDTSADSALLVSGALRAPQFTNGKPKIIQEGVETVLFPAHMAYWDGRVWLAATQDPAALHYSCDIVQCPFGIPEESYPDTNVLRIPAADGCIRGMKLIGESLLVTTERWAYTIVGNNEANYRLVRVSTRMAGVGDYQMDEFVTDVEGQTAIVVFVGTDSKVYAMPLGGQATCISKEIQTYLDAAILQLRVNYKNVRVHCMTVMGMRMALVYVPGALPGGGAAPGKTFIYNFDQKVWTEHVLQTNSVSTNVGIGVSWTTISSTEEQVSEIYSVNTTDITPPISPNPIEVVRNWFNTRVTSPLPGGYIRTFPLTLDGKKTRKQIHYIRIFVNDQSFTSVGPDGTKYPWRCTVQTDAAAAGTPMAFGDPLDPVFNSMVGGFPVDSTTAAERILAGPMLTGGPPLIGYTFDLTVYFPTQTNKLYQLYRVDVGWTTVSEEDP